MTEKFEIRLVRLKNGEDLICFCFEDYKNNLIYIKYPKVFYQSYNYEIEPPEEELVLVDWLPQEAYTIQETVFGLDNILFTSFTNNFFGYKYLNILLDEIEDNDTLVESIKKTLEKINSSIDSLSETTLH